MDSASVTHIEYYNRTAWRISMGWVQQAEHI